MIEDIDHYDATIVDFYHSNGRIDILRRSRKIRNVVYQKADKDNDGGVEQIMNQARQTLGKISEEAAKEKPYVRHDLRMRWIHLPLNSVR